MSRPPSTARDRAIAIHLLAHVMNICDQIEQLSPAEDTVKLDLARAICRGYIVEMQKKATAKP